MMATLIFVLSLLFNVASAVSLDSNYVGTSPACDSKLLVFDNSCNGLKLETTPRLALTGFCPNDNVDSGPASTLAGSNVFSTLYLDECIYYFTSEVVESNITSPFSMLWEIGTGETIL